MMFPAPGPRWASRSLYPIIAFFILLDLTLSANGLAHPETRSDSKTATSGTLDNLLDALRVMQSSYFQLWLGTWPSSIDWTAAVIGTQVAGSLAVLTSSLGKGSLTTGTSEAAGGFRHSLSSAVSTNDSLDYENVINYYFGQTSAFFFGEDAISLRGQAFDDMLWVVLDWLENIKFQQLHSDLHYGQLDGNQSLGWHGLQYTVPAAHRARLFYDLASKGWDTTLCNGGMIWSPYLTPYKNAITNELFISASIAMYLYFPGDIIDAPFSTDRATGSDPHTPAHLDAAIKGYQWLKDSNMTNGAGLYTDGFHISGYRDSNNPGSKNCDVLNTMVYTYNQGVVLSGLRGLWLATGAQDYLDDGHRLIRDVINATGWPNSSSQEWRGLGRGGVLEEFCDTAGDCTQNGHTFKGIFFHHFAEFCRPFSPQEESFVNSPAFASQGGVDIKTMKSVLAWHQSQCKQYRPWLEHNAEAALATKNQDGKFGMWWGRRYPDIEGAGARTMPSPALPAGAFDYRNTQGGDGSDDGVFDEPRPGDEAVLMRGGMDDRWLRPSQQRVNVRQSGSQDVNDRGRGRTVETQSGGVAVLKALYQWESVPSLN